MEKRNYREESRKPYTKREDENFTLEELQTGSILRIADAVEKMAGNYMALLNRVKYFEDREDELVRSRGRLNRRLSAMRGVVTKLKKRK